MQTYCKAIFQLEQLNDSEDAMVVALVCFTYLDEQELSNQQCVSTGQAQV